MKSLLFLLLTCVLWLPRLAYGQAHKEPAFSLLFLSKDIKYSAQLLEGQIRKASSVKDVKNILKKNILDKKGQILVLYRDGGKYFRFEKLLGDKPVERMKEWVVSPTRDNSLYTIDQPANFNKIFPNGLILFDSLSFIVGFSEYPINQYQGKFTSGKYFKSFSLPVVQKNHLSLTRKEFDSSNVQLAYIRLWNGSVPSNILASFKVMLPPDTLIQRWKTMAHAIKGHSTTIQMEDVTGLMQAYLHDSYGECDYYHLYRWLTKNM